MCESVCVRTSVYVCVRVVCESVCVYMYGLTSAMSHIVHFKFKSHSTATHEPSFSVDTILLAIVRIGHTLINI